MTSMASDNESNVSAFIRCNDQNITQLYMSAIEVRISCRFVLTVLALSMFRRKRTYLS